VNLFWFEGHGRAAIEQNWLTSSGVRVAGPRHRNTPYGKRFVLRLVRVSRPIAHIPSVLQHLLRIAPKLEALSRRGAGRAASPNPTHVPSGAPQPSALAFSASAWALFNWIILSRWSIKSKPIVFASPSRSSCFTPILACASVKMVIARMPVRHVARI